MPLKTDREKIVVNGDAAAVKKSIEKAKELIERCAEKGGQAYVEKAGSSQIDVKCIYESDEEEPTIIELEDVKQVMLAQTDLSLPPQMSPDVADDAKKRLDKFAKFYAECVSKGGEVRLVKDRAGDPAVEIVRAECWKIEKLREGEEGTKSGED